MRIRHFSFGNKKLPKSMAIFNITSAHNCPSKRIGLCTIGEKCYARKAEKIYKHVLPYREAQSAYWDSITAEQFVTDFLDTIKNKRVQIKTLRFSESGDFRNQTDVNKAVQIANTLQKHGIKTYCYTARVDLNFQNRGDLIVNLSGYEKFSDGARPDNVCYTELSGLQPKQYTVCKMDCKTCKKCLIRNQKYIYIRMH